MAKNATTARTATWERAYNKYLELHRSYEQAQGQDTIVSLSQKLAKQQDELMNLRAPSLSAVLQKLYLLWGETEIHGLDQDSEEKRLLLEDFEELLSSTSASLGGRPELPTFLPPAIRALPS